MSDVVSQFREFVRLDRKQRSVGLTAAEFERWNRIKRTLGKRFMPGLSDEHSDRRASLRVPVRLRVDLPSIASLRDQLMSNFSRGGLFVATAHLLEIGTRVTLHIHLDDTDERLEIPVEVVSQNVGPGYALEPPGMGMQFLDMDSATRSRLDELYEETLQRAVRGGGSA